MRTPQIRTSIIGMMFFQFFAFGAIGPVMSMYLQQFLHFSGTQTGMILAASVISSLIGPLIATYVIERMISSRWLLILSHIVLAAVSFILMTVRDFPTFIAFYAVFSIFSGPTVGLVNSITFQNMPEGRKHFGAIRSWGTGGWIIAGWLVSLIWALIPLLGVSATAKGFQPIALLVGGLGSIATILLALSLPSGKKLNTERREFIPPETWALIKKPAIVVLGAVYLLSQILDRFYTYGTAPYLSSQGLPQTWIMPVMSLGQITEIVTLFTLARFLRRFGYGTTFIVGLGMQVLRFLLYSLNNPIAAIVGVSLNGFIFAYVYTAIIMYIDGHTTTKTRAGVHQIIMFAFGGLSSLIGNLTAGMLSDRIGASATQAAGQHWSQFWMVPSSAALFILVATIIGLRVYRLRKKELEVA